MVFLDSVPYRILFIFNLNILEERKTPKINDNLLPTQHSFRNYLERVINSKGKQETDITTNETTNTRQCDMLRCMNCNVNSSVIDRGINCSDIQIFYIRQVNMGTHTENEK